MSSKVAQRLKGKTIVITGASSGIGRATAVEFARSQPDDLKLVLTARREEALKEVAKEIEGFAKGVKVLPVKLDVSKEEEIAAFVGNLPEEFKHVDVLVNNAYVSFSFFSTSLFTLKHPSSQSRHGKKRGNANVNVCTAASSKASPKPPKSPPQT